MSLEGQGGLRIKCSRQRQQHEGGTEMQNNGEDEAMGDVPSKAAANGPLAVAQEMLRMSLEALLTSSKGILPPPSSDPSRLCCLRR